MDEEQAIDKLLQRPKLSVNLAIGLLGLAYGGASRIPVPELGFWRNRAFWRHTRPGFGRAFFFRNVGPDQTKPLLRHACGLEPLGIRTVDVKGFLYASKGEPEVVVPHVVRLLETDHREERVFLLCALRDYVGVWETPALALEKFVRAAADLVSALNDVPYQPTDRRPALWALAGVAQVIMWQARAVGKTSGSSLVNSIEQLRADVAARWPAPPRPPQYGWLASIDGWSPFTAHSMITAGGPIRSLERALEAL